MKARKILAIAVAGLAVSGCVVAIGGDKDGYSTSYTTDDQRGYASVFAADVGAEAIAFTVNSNGCTDESFFDVDVRKSGDDAFSVGLVRTREDYCKAYVPNGRPVSWTYRQLGIPNGSQVSVLNGIRR